MLLLKRLGLAVTGGHSIISLISSLGPAVAFFILIFTGALEWGPPDHELQRVADIPSRPSDFEECRTFTEDANEPSATLSVLSHTTT